ncbi:hypothetical protein vseg_015226 [Gypsophila vaccaria]
MTDGCNERSDHEPVKSLSQITCLKCNECDGVLVCNSADCPIVVHKDCMSCAAYFDDGGNFYCPYCAYKHSLDECRKAKERSTLAKKALISFLDTKAVRRTRDIKIVESSKRERPDNFTFQKHISQNGASMVFEVPTKPDEIGEAHSGGVGDGTTLPNSLKDERHSLMMDNSLQTKNSENVKTKRRKTAKEMEGNCNGGVQSKQPQSEPPRTTEKDEGFDIQGLNLAQSMETTKLEYSRCRGNFQSSSEMHRGRTMNSIRLQNEYTTSKQLKANSETDNQSAEIKKDYCDHVKNMTGSPKNATCRTRKHDASVQHKESGIFSRRREVTKGTEEACYEEIEEMLRRQLEAAIHSSRKDDLSVTNRKSTEGDVNGFRVTVNSEDAGFEERFCQRTDEKQTLIKSVKYCTHSSTKLTTENQQNIDTMDGYYDGPAGKLYKQTEPLEPSKESVDVSNEDAEESDYSVPVENFSRSPIAVNKNNNNDTGKTSVIRDNHCKKADEWGKEVLQKYDVTCKSKKNVGVSYKGFKTDDGGDSSQERHHVGYGLYSKQKNRTSAHFKIRHQPRKPSGCSESDSEEYDEATRVKSRQKVNPSKKIEHTPISVGRRKKLPWTTEEEETLKEGVEIFSATANKNVPWIKILEFGSHVFDGTRTPVDLKDKWKRILSKSHASVKAFDFGKLLEKDRLTLS